jgi:antitoxin YefM
MQPTSHRSECIGDDQGSSDGQRADDRANPPSLLQRAGRPAITATDTSRPKRDAAVAGDDAIILYMATLPVAEARAQLSKLVEEASSTHERFEITRNGQRAAVLLGADDYDALQETIAVLGDSQLLRDHLDGVAALSRGDSLDEAELAEAMREAGRLPARK